MPPGPLGCLATKLKEIIFTSPFICAIAEIGRQAWLRTMCQKWRVGSSPTLRTKEPLRTKFHRTIKQVGVINLNYLIIP